MSSRLGGPNPAVSWRILRGTFQMERVLLAGGIPKGVPTGILAGGPDLLNHTLLLPALPVFQGLFFDEHPRRVPVRHSVF